MFYDLLIYKYMFFINLLIFGMLYKYMLILLMYMEIVVMTVSLILFYCVSLLSMEFILIYFLVMSVCESVLGLSVLVSVVRISGNEGYYMFNISKSS